MRNLSGFSYSENGEISLCEVDGRLHSMRNDFANISTFTNSIDNHPKINITRDMYHSVATGDENRALFLPVEEPFFKQISNILYEQGLTEALRFMATEHRNTPQTVRVVSKWALKLIESVGRIHDVFQPYRIGDRKSLVDAFSQTRNWSSSPIRCISWHPHCTKLAISTSDDAIRIYSPDTPLVPILKSKLQKHISSMSWRPCSASELAVACDSCILLWTVDPNSVVTRPSTAHSVVLRRFNHSPVTSISWSPHGEWLVSAAPSEASLLVWDVGLGQACGLKRAGNVGNTLVEWSKEGGRMVAATSGIVFRVWNCLSWTSDRWTTVFSPIQTATFSPCGTALFFATSTEPFIYSLAFAPSGIFAGAQESSSQQATPVLDLTKVSLPDGEALGGPVQKIELCPRGRYLAILFKETEQVALCMVQIKPQIQVTPSSLVSGQNGEYPSTIAFQKNFKEGSCLTIAWSSGRIQYFPLIYSDNKIDQNQTLNTENLDMSSFRTFCSY